MIYNGFAAAFPVVCNLELIIIRMLKVLLHIDSVALNVKEAELKFLIQNKVDTIEHAKGYPLFLGDCLINTDLEFIVNQSYAELALQIILHLGKICRLGGEVLLSLRCWDSNAYHKSFWSLERCPDKKGNIQFGFIYYDFEQKITGKTLLTVSEFHHFMTKQKQILLQQENKILKETIVELENDNKEIISHHQTLLKTHERVIEKN